MLKILNFVCYVFYALAKLENHDILKSMVKVAMVTCNYGDCSHCKLLQCNHGNWINGVDAICM